MIQREPIAFLDPELRGLASSIGLEKGKPFAPSPQDREILEEAIQVGVAYVRSDMGKPRNQDVYFLSRQAMVHSVWRWELRVAD